MYSQLVTKPHYKIDSLRQKYLLRKVNKLAQNGLSKLLTDAFNDVTRALIVRAGNCEEAALRHHCLEGVCLLYGKEKQLIDDYNYYFTHGFYQHIKPEGWSSSTRIGIVASRQERGLPAEGSMLTEPLLAEEAHGGMLQLERLMLQFSVILGGQVSAEKVPVGLHNIIFSFHHSLATLSASLQVNMTFHSYWHKQLSSGLAELWGQLADYIDAELYGELCSDQNVEKTAACGSSELMSELIK